MKYLFIIISILFLGCKKNDAGSTEANLTDEGCIVPRSVNDGDTVVGQYIVAYAPGIVHPDISAKGIAVSAESTLRKHSIKLTSLLKSFQGGAGGFVAKLSREEAIKLKADPSVSIVEPDRIVALGNCFTVVAP
jgi:subtilisin